MADPRFPPSALGIDPSGVGVVGAAYVVIAPDGAYELRGWWACRCNRKGRWTIDGHDWPAPRKDVSRTEAVHRVVSTAPTPDVLVVEETPPIGAGGKERLIVQAEGAGVVVGLAESVHGLEALRPDPRDWRDLLTPPGVAALASDPEGVAARCAWGWCDYPRRQEPSFTGRSTCPAPPPWAAEHVAEAGIMAAWGLRR